MLLSGWSPYPGAPEPRRRALGPVPDGVVVGIGAICDLRPPAPEQPTARRFSVSEFVRLEDGRCVLLHEERGGTSSAPMGPGAPAGDEEYRDSAESLTQFVLTVVLPDSDEEARIDAHPWTWLAGLAQARGLSVTAEQLRVLDYEVVFSDKLKRWMAGE